MYDLAPTGYVTVSEKGLILEVNLTAATLLGVARSALVNQPITRFILKGDQNIYYQHCKQLFGTGEPQTCELWMLSQAGAQFWTHLEATAAQDADGAPVCRVVMSDITERKQTENLLHARHCLSLRLASASSFEEALSSCLDMILDISGMDCGGVYRVSPTTGDFDLLSSRGLSERFVEEVVHLQANSLLGRIALAGNPIWLEAVHLRKRRCRAFAWLYRRPGLGCSEVGEPWNHGGRDRL